MYRASMCNQTKETMAKKLQRKLSRISYKLMNMLLIKTLSAKEIHLQIENLTVTGEQQKVFS